MKKFWAVKDAAKQLGITPGSVYSLMRTGRLEKVCSDDGTLAYITSDSLEKCLIDRKGGKKIIDTIDQCREIMRQIEVILDKEPEDLTGMDIHRLRCKSMCVRIGIDQVEKAVEERCEEERAKHRRKTK